MHYNINNKSKIRSRCQESMNNKRENYEKKKQFKGKQYSYWGREY